MLPSVSILKITKNPYKAGSDHIHPESGSVISNPSERNQTDGEGGVSFQNRNCMFICLEFVEEAGRGWCLFF